MIPLIRLYFGDRVANASKEFVVARRTSGVPSVFQGLFCDTPSLREFSLMKECLPLKRFDLGVGKMLRVAMVAFGFGHMSSFLDLKQARSVCVMSANTSCDQHLQDSVFS